MNLRRTLLPNAGMAALLLAAWYLPAEDLRLPRSLAEACFVLRDYARTHVFASLAPALLLSGTITVFIRREAVLRHLGPGATPWKAFLVASLSGGVLAVCSCSVLPLFAGIYALGAGLGPAIAFLYAAPAINVLAVTLTARLLGPQIGVERAVAAILSSLCIGFLMQALFRNNAARESSALAVLPSEGPGRPAWQVGALFLAQVPVLLAACCGPEELFGLSPAAVSLLQGALMAGVLAAWFGFPVWKLGLVAGLTVATAWLAPHRLSTQRAVALAALWIALATEKGDLGDWARSAWNLAHSVFPLFLLGVFCSGLLFGRPGEEGLVPAEWIRRAVGGDSLGASACAAVLGTLMYFATLTEVPIVQGLRDAGMGHGPALALLLAGPALSLPALFVLYRLLGARKALAYAALTALAATLAGWAA